MFRVHRDSPHNPKRHLIRLLTGELAWIETEQNIPHEVLFPMGGIFAGSVDTNAFQYQSTATWSAIGTLNPPEVSPKKPATRIAYCDNCGLSMGASDIDSCQICGHYYHRVGCGITTESSRTCFVCMRQGRFPAGYRREEW